MEYLVVAAILYFVLRTGANLVRLLAGEEGEDGSTTQGQARPGSSRRQRWEGPSPRQQTGAARDEPTFWGEDIEDATWYDVDEGSTRSPPP